MPKAPRKKMAPEGFEEIRPTLDELQRKLREAERDDDPKVRSGEGVWPVLRINHQRSRYIYEMYFVKHRISEEVYNYCIERRLADEGLIAKWRKPGFEKLCCVLCAAADKSHGTVCICRVPKIRESQERVLECRTCGCRGCSG